MVTGNATNCYIVRDVQSYMSLIRKCYLVDSVDISSFCAYIVIVVYPATALIEACFRVYRALS